ncbi:MAG: hypothetical protein U0W24_00655 [Bacteroidales bacterium]
MRQFEFTTATKEEITSKLDVFKELQTLFNERLKISDYTEIYTSIFMVYQCFPENSPYFNAKAYSRIRRKTNVIEIYSLVDYDAILKADENKIKSLLSETYLSSINQFLKIKGFNYEQFYIDAKQIMKPFLI